MPLKISFFARQLIESRLPCDVLVFDKVWADIAEDIILQVVAAMLKEPAPVIALVQHVQRQACPLEERTVNFHVEALHHVCRSVSNQATPEVWENLNDQGGLYIE